jgi:hypothetical protein
VAGKFWDGSHLRLASGVVTRGAHDHPGELRIWSMLLLPKDRLNGVVNIRETSAKRSVKHHRLIRSGLLHARCTVLSDSS